MYPLCCALQFCCTEHVNIVFCSDLSLVSQSEKEREGRKKGERDREREREGDTRERMAWLVRFLFQTF